MKILSLNKETFVDGEGARLAIYFSGCSHKCPNCQNPSTWDENAGEPITSYLYDIMVQLQRNFMLSGITLSGGDPFYNPKELLSFLKWLDVTKSQINPKLTIWAYTGYVFENMLSSAALKDCLSYIDVLVDGPYMKDLPPVRYRGSSNQRLVLAKKSLKEHKLFLYDIDRK